MKLITKTIRSGYCENKSWKKAIYQILLNYRSTPHCKTGYSTRYWQNTIASSVKIKEIDKDAKERMKRYADGHQNAKEMNIEVGGTVLVKQLRVSKISIRFNP